MEALRVNFLMHGTGRTGGVRVALTLASELSKLGHEVSVSTTYHVPWYSLPPDVQVFKPPAWRNRLISGLLKVRGESVALQMQSMRDLYGAIPDADVNVATFCLTAFPAFWAMGRAAPLYFCQHFETLFFSTPQLQAMAEATYFLPIPKVANSTWLAQRLESLTGAQTPVVLPGIDRSVFHPRARSELGGFRIACLSKGGWKNSQLVTSAAQSLSRRLHGGRDVSLYLFGVHKPAGLPSDFAVKFLHQPSDEQLAQLYSNSDAFVTASVAESSPLPPLEAMACGCPVVTTPVGTEDWAVDGWNCLLWDPRKPASLLDALSRLYTDEHLKGLLRTNGLETIKRFTIETQGHLFEQLVRGAHTEWLARQDQITNGFHRIGLPLV